MYDLVKKEQKWKWRLRQKKKLFEVLKKWFTMEPVLVIPDLDKKMRIEMDMSDCAIEGVLSMKYSDGR